MDSPVPDVVAISRIALVTGDEVPITSESDFASSSGSSPCLADASRRRRAIVKANRALSSHGIGIFINRRYGSLPTARRRSEERRVGNEGRDRRVGGRE